MVYVVNCMYVYDDYKRAGASTEIVGVFSTEDAAYNCAVQQYCEYIIDSDKVEDLNELEEKLLGTPKEMYERLHLWRDDIFVPEFTRDRVGPIISVTSIQPKTQWDLNKYFVDANISPRGRLQQILSTLTVSNDKLGVKGMQELIAQVPRIVSLDDATRLIAGIVVTPAAKKLWVSYATELEQELEQERKREVSEGASSTHQMVLVPAGTFEMGALEGDGAAVDDATPRHRVTISRDILVGKYPVTQGLYESVMGENPSDCTGSTRPVECVSWYDAVSFCNKLSVLEGREPVYSGLDDYEMGMDLDEDEEEELLNKIRCNFGAKGYRLLTEAEWEYCARSGQRFKYSGSDDVDEVAWYCDNSCGETHPVGLKKPNGFGLYDMSGNVWEWVWDWYGDYSSGTQVDPHGPSRDSFRVHRGGSWFLNPEYVRVSFRDGDSPAGRDGSIGFRLGLPL